MRMSGPVTLVMAAALAAVLLLAGCGEDRQGCGDTVVYLYQRHLAQQCYVDTAVMPVAMLDCSEQNVCEEVLTSAGINDELTLTCACNALFRCSEGLDACYSDGHVDPDDLYY